jgi:hypothetical protein
LLKRLLGTRRRKIVAGLSTAAAGLSGGGTAMAYLLQAQRTAAGKQDG